MIEAPTPCFFTGFFRDEAAQSVMQELFPSIAADVVELTIMSNDFSTDIEALNNLDDTAGKVRAVLPEEISFSEKFNPIFIPQSLDEVDAVLDAQMKSDNLRFVGFNGNPFTVKHIEMKKDDKPIGVFLAQFHPFELPAYSEIISSYEQFLPN